MILTVLVALRFIAKSSSLGTIFNLFLQVSNNGIANRFSGSTKFATTCLFSEELNFDHIADKVYTVGCFDLFHHGHVQLLKRMRQYGKKVVVGVHDSRSIYKLKNRVPVDSTEKRMLNVKAYADEVYCVPNDDPSSFISSIVSLNENERAVYIRGDDMPNFPAKDVVESLMDVKFVPYTEGVSSTALRKQNFAHIKADDEEYLDKNS